MSNDNNNNNSSEKDTVGEVGSPIPGGLDPKPEPDQQVHQRDLKGKKVDADPTEESGKPAE